MKKSSVSAVLTFFLFTIPLFAQSQDLKKYTKSIDLIYMKDVLTYLSDDTLEGRGTSTIGQLIAGTMIAREFERNGMIPFYHRTFTQSFQKDTLIVRNIIGVVRARYYSEKYIVVSAHYDHLGILGGKIYNGADDNASGVAMMMTLAKLFSDMRAAGDGVYTNIIFAAFDGKEHNMVGSDAFVKKLPISKNNIICNINIDQIGTIFAPPTVDTNYVLVLGTKSNRGYKKIVESANINSGSNLSINYNYYGSPDFADIFYKASDQYSFIKAGIPALVFTSGIHMHTYKPTDDYYFMNYPVLFKRTALIFNLINIISSSL